MTKVFNNIKEIEKYYNKETDTYSFRGKNFVGKVILNFDLNVESNIEAFDISALNITAKNIRAWDVTAWEINACDIDSNDINAGMIKARNIAAFHINTMNIYARDIDAFSINAVNIYARDILYTTICSAYEDFKCNSIKCIGPTPLHRTYYGKLEVIKNDK